MEKAVAPSEGSSSGMPRGWLQLARDRLALAISEDVVASDASIGSDGLLTWRGINIALPDVILGRENENTDNLHDTPVDTSVLASGIAWGLMSLINKYLTKPHHPAYRPLLALKGNNAEAMTMTELRDILHLAHISVRPLLDSLSATERSLIRAPGKVDILDDETFSGQVLDPLCDLFGLDHGDDIADSISILQHIDSDMNQYLTTIDSLRKRYLFNVNSFTNPVIATALRTIQELPVVRYPLDFELVRMSAVINLSGTP